MWDAPGKSIRKVGRSPRLASFRAGQVGPNWRLASFRSDLPQGRSRLVLPRISSKSVKLAVGFVSHGAMTKPKRHERLTFGDNLLQNKANCQFDGIEEPGRNSPRSRVVEGTFSGDFRQCFKSVPSRRYIRGTVRFSRERLWSGIEKVGGLIVLHRVSRSARPAFDSGPFAPVGSVPNPFTPGANVGSSSFAPVRPVARRSRAI